MKGVLVTYQLLVAIVWAAAFSLFMFGCALLGASSAIPGLVLTSVLLLAGPVLLACGSLAQVFWYRRPGAAALVSGLGSSILTLAVLYSFGGDVLPFLRQGRQIESGLTLVVLVCTGLTNVSVYKLYRRNAGRGVEGDAAF